MSEAPPTLLHVSPHADDELIGAPATLMALRDAGWRVVNLVCSLGRASDQARRGQEVHEACRRAGFELELLSPLLADPIEVEEVDAARDSVTAGVAEALDRLGPLVLVAPSPHDRHRGHEVVGRGVLAACSPQGGQKPAPRLWMWGLWADLPMPTLALQFDESRLAEISSALEAHQGELARNDYRRLVSGRASMNASVGPERVFGFGAPAGHGPYVELLCEVARRADRWVLGHPRWLDPVDPLGAVGRRDVSEWLDSRSITDEYGPPPMSDPGPGGSTIEV